MYGTRLIDKMVNLTVLITAASEADIAETVEDDPAD